MAPYKAAAVFFFGVTFLAVFYRLCYELPTYFWQCKTVEITSVKIVDLKYEQGISVTYKLKEQPNVSFSKVAPIAVEQNAAILSYPYRYLDMISSGAEQSACFSDSGADAVLFKGVSLETLYYLAILAFLFLLIVCGRTSGSVMK
jgi:hypothetical protein